MTNQNTSSQHLEFTIKPGTPEWYIEIEGSRVGPYTVEEVDTLASAGLFDKKTKIYHHQQIPNGIYYFDFKEKINSQSKTKAESISQEPTSSENTRVEAVLQALEATKLTQVENFNLKEVTPPPPPTNTQFTPSEVIPFSPPPRPREAAEGTGLIRVPKKDGSFEAPTDPAIQLFEAVQLAREKKATSKAASQRLEDLSLQAYTDGIQETKRRGISSHAMTIGSVIVVFNLAMWGIWSLMQKVGPQNLEQSVQNGPGKFTSLQQDPSATEPTKGRAPASSPAEIERKKLEREKRVAEEKARRERLDAERRVEEERKRKDRLEREEREREEKEREKEEKEREEAYKLDDPVRELSTDSVKIKRGKTNQRDIKEPLDPIDLLEKEESDIISPENPNPTE